MVNPSRIPPRLKFLSPNKKTFRGNISFYRYIAKSSKPENAFTSLRFNSREGYEPDKPGRGPLLVDKLLKRPLKNCGRGQFEALNTFHCLKGCAKKGLKKARYPLANLRPAHAAVFFHRIIPTGDHHFLFDTNFTKPGFFFLSFFLFCEKTNSKAKILLENL